MSTHHEGDKDSATLHHNVGNMGFLPWQQPGFDFSIAPRPNSVEQCTLTTTPRTLPSFLVAIPEESTKDL